MNIEELAKRKVELQRILQGIGMWNTYGQTIEKLAEVEYSKIQAQKELYEIQRKIDNYVNLAGINAPNFQHGVITPKQMEDSE